MFARWSLHVRAWETLEISLALSSSRLCHQMSRYREQAKFVLWKYVYRLDRDWRNMAAPRRTCICHSISAEFNEISSFTETTWNKYCWCAERWYGLVGKESEIASNFLHLWEQFGLPDSRCYGYHKKCYRRWVSFVYIMCIFGQISKVRLALLCHQIVTLHCFITKHIGYLKPSPAISWIL